MLQHSTFARHHKAFDSRYFDQRTASMLEVDDSSSIGEASSSGASSSEASKHSWLIEEINNFTPQPQCETPAFSCRAHVFNIDPVSRKQWIPASKQAITVSFFNDPSKKQWKIISVDQGKAIINSVITSSMVFTKTSTKFGQWSDSKMGTVYGIGFSNEEDLFQEKFAEIRELTATASLSRPESSTASAIILSNHNGPDYATTAPPPPSLPHRMHNNNSLASSSPKSGQIPVDRSADLIDENERLRNALTQSVGNVKKWESELNSLKSENVRLQKQLNETERNVDEWKGQMGRYRDELHKIKRKTKESVVNTADDEAVVPIKDESAAPIANPSRLQQLERDNKLLIERLEKAELDRDLAQQKLEMATFDKTAQRELLTGISSQLDNKINELRILQDKIKSLF